MDFDMIISRSMSMELSDEAPVDHEYPLEDKRRNVLCEQLLDIIKSSVLTFKPSKSLSSFNSKRSSEPDPSVEIDIVVSGGGLKGYFMCGCSHILKHELAKQNVKIARIAGASAGAWVGLFMLTDFSTENWLETYYLSKERPGMTMHEAYRDLWPWLQGHMPENAWEICNGRLFISITEVTPFGLKNHMISDYTCNEDLFEACMCSSTVPYISLPTMMYKFRDMWCVDGGVTNNTPIFPDHVRRQLVFQLGDVFYPVRHLINPNDLCIESLVVRGAMLMARFLQGEPSDSFSWLNPSGYIGSAKQLGRLSGGNNNDNNTSFYDGEEDDGTAVTKRPRRRPFWRTVALTSTAVAVLGGASWYFLKEEQKTSVREFVMDLSKRVKLQWKSFRS